MQENYTPFSEISNKAGFNPYITTSQELNNKSNGEKLDNLKLSPGKEATLLIKDAQDNPANVSNKIQTSITNVQFEWHAVEGSGSKRRLETQKDSIAIMSRNDSVRKLCSLTIQARLTGDVGDLSAYTLWTSDEDGNLWSSAEGATSALRSKVVKLICKGIPVSTTKASVVFINILSLEAKKVACRTAVIVVPPELPNVGELFGSACWRISNVFIMSWDDAKKWLTYFWFHCFNNKSRGESLPNIPMPDLEQIKKLLRISNGLTQEIFISALKWLHACGSILTVPEARRLYDEGIISIISSQEVPDLIKEKYIYLLRFTSRPGEIAIACLLPDNNKLRFATFDTLPIPCTQISFHKLVHEIHKFFHGATDGTLLIAKKESRESPIHYKSEPLVNWVVKLENMFHLRKRSGGGGGGGVNSNRNKKSSTTTINEPKQKEIMEIEINDSNDHSLNLQTKRYSQMYGEEDTFSI